MAKWKYTKERPRFSFEEYLNLDLDKEYKIKVAIPEIMKKLIDGNYRTIFQGSVIELDGKPVEKLLVIRNYENVQFLKKKIAKKKEIDLIITRKYNDDDMETYFDIKVGWDK